MFENQFTSIAFEPIFALIGKFDVEVPDQSGNSESHLQEGQAARTISTLYLTPHGENETHFFPMQFLGP